MSGPEIAVEGGSNFGIGSPGSVNAQNIGGSVFNVTIQGPVTEKVLERIARLPTEVGKGGAAGAAESPPAGESQRMQEQIDELLTLLKKRAPAEQANPEIESGHVHLSRVDLLLKKAILVKTAAEQMHFDQLARHRDAAERASAGSPGATFQVDLNEIFADFDDAAHDARLREAHALLKEANGIDPTNTEVLLHMAQLLMELTPDDPRDEQEILYRIQKLLESPRDDAERFRLAQATFLLATSWDSPDHRLLRDARAEFARLGRADWVRQCDALLAAPVSGSGPGGQPPGLAESGSGPHGFTQPGFQQPGFQQPGFQQAGIGPGRWHVQVSDAVGSTMSLDLRPDGTFQAVQQAAMVGMAVQAAGQWIFMPAEHTLHLQGMVNGFQPFMLAIMIQQMHGGVAYGVGSDGLAYAMARS